MFIQEMQVPMEEVLSRLDLLAAKLGIAVDVLWGALLTQARLQMLWPVFALLVMTALLGFSLWSHKLYVKADEECDCQAEEFWGCAAVIGAIFTGIMVLIFTLVSIEATLAWLNPEYWAYRHLFP